jgi:curved DNA-binding protein CbpA
MKTLYDLLGALPHDGSEGLRTSFRRAVKGAHPDLRPDDPDAALRFREIVRANEILGDPELRATYDHLLVLARMEQESAHKNVIAARIHKLASGVIAFSGASVVAVGGYLLFMHMSAASIASANGVDVRASPEIAAVSPATPPDSSEKPASSAKRESEDISDETIGPRAASRTAAQSFPTVRLGPAAEFAALDPKFMPAYADRGIIFFRPRKFSRAFSGIARTKRTESANRPVSVPTIIAKKPPVDQVATAPAMTPLPQRRPTAQDPSREAGLLVSARSR